jgi:hypothetical protein
LSGDLPVGPAEGYLLAFEEARGLARQEAQIDAMPSDHLIWAFRAASSLLAVEVSMWWSTSLFVT